MPALRAYGRAFHVAICSTYRCLPWAWPPSLVLGCGYRYHSLKDTGHAEFLQGPRQAGLCSHCSIPAGATDFVLKFLLMWQRCQAVHSQTSHLKIDKFLNALGWTLLTGPGIMARHLRGDLDACPFDSVCSICNVSRYLCQIMRG